jgi:hypothetical protein
MKIVTVHLQMDTVVLQLYQIISDVSQGGAWWGSAGRHLNFCSKPRANHDIRLWLLHALRFAPFDVR